MKHTFYAYHSMINILNFLISLPLRFYQNQVVYYNKSTKGYLLDSSFVKMTKRNYKIEKASISDIDDKFLRYTIYFLNTFFYPFKPIKTYKTDHEYNNRTALFLTQEKVIDLYANDYYGVRVSDSNYYYKKHQKEQRRNPEKPFPLKNFCIVINPKTKRHDITTKFKEDIYEQEKNKSLEKLVNKIIKEDKSPLGRTSQSKSDWTNLPIIFKLVKNNRIDLIEKILDYCIDDKERVNVLTQKIDVDGWEDKYGDDPICYAKSEDMKDYLKKQIEKYKNKL